MKHNTYLTDSVMRGWEFLTGDYNYTQYGGSWVKQLTDTVYHVIELINLWDTTGEKDQPQYAVQLKEVDIESPLLDQAIGACGFPDDFDFESDPLGKVDALTSYGGFAPMGVWSGNDYRELLRQAKREANRLAGDAGYRRRQMRRPVNKIGSIAAEVARGDYDSALIRGIARGDRTARLLGKIKGWSGEDMDSIAREAA